MREVPIHQSHVYGRIKILQTIFEKGHPRNIPVKLFQNLTIGFGEEDFLRISSCPYSAKSPHSPEPCLWMDQNFANNFWKGSPKEHSCEIILKSDQLFLRRRFFKTYLKNSISLPWQPELLMESNSVNKFWRGPPKEHSCQVWSKLAQRFVGRRCLKKLLRTHDGHLTTLKAPLEHEDQHYLLLPSQRAIAQLVPLWTGEQEVAGSIPQLSQYSFQGLMSHCDSIHSSLTAVHCFDNVYVGKQPVAWKEYCAEHWLKELQERMDRCTGCHDITAILLKTAIKTI